jgi:hypothetical protein
LEHIRENKPYYIYYKTAAPSYKTNSQKEKYTKNVTDFVRQIRDWALTDGRTYPQENMRNFYMNRIFNSSKEEPLKEIEVSSIYHNMGLI